MEKHQIPSEFPHYAMTREQKLQNLEIMKLSKDIVPLLKDLSHAPDLSQFLEPSLTFKILNYYVKLEMADDLSKYISNNQEGLKAVLTGNKLNRLLVQAAPSLDLFPIALKLVISLHNEP